MNANPSGTTEREPNGLSVSADPPDRLLVDAVWCVLEAANDLGDIETVNACRRVIDANLSGRLAMQADVKIVAEYFR
jgi:hypothetical protein